MSSTVVQRHSGDDAIQSTFTWPIANFSTVTEDTYSDVLVISGFQWRLNIFLGECVNDEIPALQVDLLVELSSTLPRGWSRNANFHISVVDQVRNLYTRSEGKQHKFEEGNYDGGFSFFIPVSHLHDHTKGFIMNDMLIINVGVYVNKLPVTNTFILKTPASRAQPCSTFTWSIMNFSRVYELNSKVFEVGGCEWRAMVEVFDHKTSKLPPNLTLRLQIVNSADLGHYSDRYTQFKFSVIDQVSGRHTVREDGQYKFAANTIRVDGLVMPLRDLWDPRKGFLVDDILIIEVGILEPRIYSTRTRLAHDNCLPEQPEPSPKIPLNTMILKTISEAQADTISWTIKNFSRVTTKHHSQIFVMGGYEWRATVYLDDYGKPGFRPPNLTIFLSVANSTQLSPGWSRDTKFRFSVVDQVSSRHTSRKDGKHRFEAKGLRVGVVSVSLSDLWNPRKGYLVDDTLIVEVEIDPSKVSLKPTCTKPMTKCNLSSTLKTKDRPSTSAAHSSNAPPSSCVICMDALSEGACVPCGHMAGCMSCLDKIKAKKMGCPVCRAKIEMVVRIFSI